MRRIAKSIGNACLLLLVVVFPTSVSVSAQVGRTDDGEFLRKARATYYSAWTLGLKRFQCHATPDWKAFSKSRPALFEQLQGIEYSVVAGFQGPLEIKATAIRPNKNKGDQNAELMISAYGKQIEAFFEMWLGFFQILDDLSSGKFHVSHKAADRYFLSSKDTQLEFDLDYAIKKMTHLPLTTEFYALPVFSKLDGNLRVLTKVEAVISGHSLQTSVQYEDSQGFKLPHKIICTHSFGSAPPMEIAFSEYHLN